MSQQYSDFAEKDMHHAWTLIVLKRGVYVSENRWGTGQNQLLLCTQAIHLQKNHWSNPALIYKLLAYVHTVRKSCL